MLHNLYHLTRARSLYIDNVCNIPLHVFNQLQPSDISLRGCDIRNFNRVKGVRILDVTRNPIESILFSMDLIKIQISKECVNMCDTPTMVPSLVTICEGAAQRLVGELDLASVRYVSDVLGTISAHRHTHRACDMCGERLLCEKLSVYGFMKYLCCYKCMMFGARPMYNVTFNDDVATLKVASARGYHTFDTDGEIHVAARVSALTGRSLKMQYGVHDISKHDHVFRFNRQNMCITSKSSPGRGPSICFDRFENDSQPPKNI